MPLKLYELTDKYQHALHALSALEDIDDETIQNTLEGLQGDIEEKALNVAAYVQNILAETQTMRDYVQRMRGRYERLENQAKRMKAYLKFEMERSDLKSIKGEELSLAIRASKCSVIVDDEEKFILQDKDHVHRHTSYKIDKASIFEVLKGGGSIEGAHLETNTHLRII